MQILTTQLLRRLKKGALVLFKGQVHAVVYVSRKRDLLKLKADTEIIPVTKRQVQNYQRKFEKIRLAHAHAQRSVRESYAFIATRSA